MRASATLEARLPFRLLPPLLESPALLATDAPTAARYSTADAVPAAADERAVVSSADRATVFAVFRI